MNVQTRFFPALIADLLDDENHPTATAVEQKLVEANIRKCYDRFEQLIELESTAARALNATATLGPATARLPTLYRAEHLRYIEAALRRLSSSYECLDSSRPWMVYWILNAAALLGHRFDDELLDQVVGFLLCCRCDETGGFAGGPGQMAHLAPTYAAVNSLCLIGTERALQAIGRQQLREFLQSVRQPDGSFVLHVGGESDIRGVYCAVSVAKLAGLSAKDLGMLFDGTVQWIASCQTYEGGIGGAPDLEAHGGYAFCGVAALALLGSTGGCDLRALMRWSINRQMRYEGGFQGRSNKLVDGCYSFWQGAVMPIVQALIFAELQAEQLSSSSSSNTTKSQQEKQLKSDPRLQTYRSYLRHPLFNRGALQEYLLICCQLPTGGLVDKPGKPKDLYHTCYTLSGLAIAQHSEQDIYPLIVGHPDNEVCATHVLYNIPAMAVWQAADYFRRNRADLYADSDGENGDDDEDDEKANRNAAGARESSSRERSSSTGRSGTSVTTTMTTTEDDDDYDDDDDETAASK